MDFWLRSDLQRLNLPNHLTLVESSWGGAKGFTTYLTSKAFEVATEIMKRRGMEFSAQESAILEHVFELSASYRTD